MTETLGAGTGTGPIFRSVIVSVNAAGLGLLNIHLVALSMAAPRVGSIFLKCPVNRSVSFLPVCPTCCHSPNALVQIVSSLPRLAPYRSAATLYIKFFRAAENAVHPVTFVNSVTRAAGSVTSVACWAVGVWR